MISLKRNTPSTKVQFTSKGLAVNGAPVEIDDKLMLADGRTVIAKWVGISPYYAEEVAGIYRVMVYTESGLVDYVLLDEIIASAPADTRAPYAGNGTPIACFAQHCGMVGYLENIGTNGRCNVTLWDSAARKWFAYRITGEQIFSR